MSIITLSGGVAFFLFGMFSMGEALEKVAGNRMQMILGKLVSTPLKGVLLGTFVTAIIQSSSATSVMVVSFVNSGIMNLDQAISVIMGANIGTTATGWILTLAGLDSNAALGSLLSTTTIFAIVAVVGIVIYMAGKSTATQNVGVILISLSILMSGMKSMSSAMEPLQSSEAFLNVMAVVSNPILCIIVGIIVTAIIQSCSASIGILQAISITGIISHSVAIPMVVGMSIGACVPVLISAITANKDGKRTALSYLYFNILGGTIFMALYSVIGFTGWGARFYSSTASSMSIATINTLFKVFSVVVLFPFVPYLKKLVTWSVKDKSSTESILLDEMLLNYPSQAIERSGEVINRMAHIAVENISVATELLSHFNTKEYTALLQRESKQDEYDDKLSNFLIMLNAKELSFQETRQTAKYLRCITDLERISDHSERVAKMAKELYDENKNFSDQAKAEIAICIEALAEIMDLMQQALEHDNFEAAYRIEPLEEIIDALIERLKEGHIDRLQKGECNLDTGFVFNDCINNFERVAAHCSNIAVSVIEMRNNAAFETHSYRHALKHSRSERFQDYLNEYDEKYVVKIENTKVVLLQVPNE